MESAEPRSNSKWEWVLYIIVLPGTFTLVLTGILLTFLGYDVKNTLLEWGNSIPVVEKAVPGPSPSNGQAAPADSHIWRTQIDQLNAKLKQQQAISDKLTEELKEKEEQILHLQTENRMLKDDQQQQAQENLKIKETAGMYAEMTPSKAAAIMEKLAVPEAMNILKAMNKEVRGSILEKMDPNIAAQMTSALMEPGE